VVAVAVNFPYCRLVVWVEAEQAAFPVELMLYRGLQTQVVAAAEVAEHRALTLEAATAALAS
jgi:hypothetical protein